MNKNDAQNRQKQNFGNENFELQKTFPNIPIKNQQLVQTRSIFFLSRIFLSQKWAHLNWKVRKICYENLHFVFLVIITNLIEIRDLLELKICPHHAGIKLINDVFLWKQNKMTTKTGKSIFFQYKRKWKKFFHAKENLQISKQTAIFTFQFNCLTLCLLQGNSRDPSPATFSIVFHPKLILFVFWKVFFGAKISLSLELSNRSFPWKFGKNLSKFTECRWSGFSRNC